MESISNPRFKVWWTGSTVQSTHKTRKSANPLNNTQLPRITSSAPPINYATHNRITPPSQAAPITARTFRETSQVCPVPSPLLQPPKFTNPQHTRSKFAIHWNRRHPMTAVQPHLESLRSENRCTSRQISDKEREKRKIKAMLWWVVPK